MLGMRVYVFGQSPQFAADVQHIDYISGLRRRLGEASWPISFDTGLNDLIKRQAKGAIYVDPLSYLCAGRSCVYREGDVFYYADYGHFSTVGSLRAVRAYFPSGLPSEARMLVPSQ